MKESHLQQDLANEAVIQVNGLITGLNADRGFVTPWPANYIHRYDHTKGKYAHHYQHLYDGCHPDHPALNYMGQTTRQMCP